MAKKSKTLPEEISLDISKFNSNQQIELEELLNADFARIAAALGGKEQFINDDGERMRSGKINRALIYVALKDEYPDLTIEEAGEVPLSALTPSSDESSEPEVDETA